TEAVVDGDDRPRCRPFGDELTLLAQHPANALVHEEIERASRMPEVGVAELPDELIPRALLDVLQADALHQLAEVAGGDKGDVVAASLKGEAEADERVNVAGTAEGEEEDVHRGSLARKNEPRITPMTPIKAEGK